MVRVKFLTDTPKRYARAIAGEPQFEVEVGTVVDLDEATLAQIPSERYEVVDADYVEPAAKIDEPDADADDESDDGEVSRKAWQ